MKVYFPKIYGFCFGVKNAMDKALSKQKEKNKPIYILGDLIHNDDAIQYLKENNVITINEINNLKNETVIIRTHGEPKETYDNLKNNEIYDLTCPFVKKIHNIVNEYYKKGYKIIILGEKNHPEIICINGWCNNEGEIINSKEDAKKYNNACIVSQTTFVKEKFDELLPLIQGENCVVFNTICNHTSLAQKSVVELSKHVDTMIIIGGKKSSNTKKLYNLAKENCKNTIIIENVKDLKINDLTGEKIGIGAGASTPDFIIKEVKEVIENL